MSKHAPLSPSASSIWLKCPGMPRLAEKVPYKVSEPAVVGTLIHNMAEIYLKDLMDGCSLEDYWLGKEEMVDGIKIKVDEKMIDCAKTYVDYIVQRKEDLNGKLLIEEKLYIDEISNNCYGTADAVIISKNRIVVCDLKSGKYPVDVKDNPQLMIYGLGALARYGNENTTLELTIIQPRSYHPDGQIRSLDISAEDLTDWGYEVLLQGTTLCESDNPDLVIGNHCGFCNAKSICPKMKKLTGVIYDG